MTAGASTSERSAAAIAELTAAAATLRSTLNHPISVATAEMLDAQADHWRMGFPAEPTRLDKATVELARAVAANTKSKERIR